MDFSAVSSALKTIGELTQQVTSLLGVDDQLESLERELRWMQSFLKLADARTIDNEVIRTTVAEIRELAYDTEDVIETFALKVASKRNGGFSNCIKRSACFLKEACLLHQTRSEIKKVTGRIDELTRRLKTYDAAMLGTNQGEGPSSSTERREARRPFPHKMDDNIVGMEGDIEKLVSVLVEEGSESRVVSICGMGDRRGHLHELQCLSDEHSWDLFQKIAFPQTGPTELTSSKPSNINLLAERGTWQAKLIQLWVAEGFVSSNQEERDGGEIAEDVAERYLMELVERCMVQVRKRDFKIKTIQMHDLMRDLCVKKAEQESLVFIVDQSNASSLSTIPKVRRVSSHKFFWIQCINCPNLRSLLFFDEFIPEEAFIKLFPQTTMNYVKDHVDKVLNPLLWISIISMYGVLFCVVLPKMLGVWRHICNNFRLLRVLDYEGGTAERGGKLSNDIGNLIHLRFLSLKGLQLMWKLPSSLGDLSCLQTLDIRIDQLVHVPNVIWRIEQLRHLYLPMNCNSKTKLKLATLINLQTLVNFNPESCYIADLINMTNLRELVILGLNQPEEDPMSTLQQLPNLRALKFLAGSANKIFCSAQGFPKLESLEFKRFYGLEELNVDEGAMPCLRRFVINNCSGLEVVPDGLRFITTLQELKIKSMPKAFKDRAEEGGEDFYKVQHVPSIIFHQCYIMQSMRSDTS
ncbi:hypothetical protein V6N11_016580 [Hibiscus sabdariffa]|uniref:Rx N-terminal domain-containing protein n=1 Tax=Hibiscus sabdariffa TaxID=183260 RepID=A0ABR2TVV7_9ROSI